jgi:hypothetical protein
VTRKSRLTKLQKLNAIKLLPMKYTPAELATELGCNVDTVYRSLLPAGCPHERDEAGRVWIIGTAFRQWMAETMRPDRVPLADGEAFCMSITCRKAVKMIGPFTVKPTNKYLEMVVGTCSECGGTVNRARTRRLAEQNETSM